MSSTSQKHQNFITEPMKDKPVTELAGVGEVYGKKLSDKGFNKAYVVLGQYLLLKRNEELFTMWLKDTVQMPERYALSCFKCLDEWCDQFIF